LRAHATGQAVLKSHSAPKPPFISDKRLREQHFGIAEGQRWVIETPPNKTFEELYADGIFPVLKGRDEKFPEAESLNDLARRAESAIADCVVPHLAAAAEGDIHIAIASHGLCISELIAALLRLDPDSRRDISYAGLLNTAWTRAVVSVKVPVSLSASS
jgi:broad specificity phosphatase PhoE